MIPSGKKIYLCTPDLRIKTQLNGVKVETVNYNEHVKDFDELTFEVDEYIEINGQRVQSNGYDLLDAYMNLYLEDIGCFQMEHPEISHDGYTETKSIVAHSLEKEFMDKDFVGMKINTGDADSLEQVAENNLNDLGFAKEFITFYRPDKKDLSLLHIILEKMPGWSVSDDDIDIYLWDKKLSFDEDNINLYALLTSTIAPKAECIFLFDTIHRKIKAVSKHNVDYETNIFIGFRNLANTVSIRVDEDSVFTRFNCEGADGLTVNDWNYNDSRILDLSYFLREPYMTPSLVSKVTQWVEWRDLHREAFSSASKKLAQLEEQIYDLNYRVPNDADNYKQWDNMEKDSLQKNLNYYRTLLTSLQVSVDPTWDEDKKDYDSYLPWKKPDGTVDHDRYLDLLYNQENGYGGYYTYYEILNYIIPNIEIAIENFDISADDKQDPVTEYETNWDLYGIKELEGKKKAYEEQLDVLKEYSKPWEELSDEEQAKYTIDDNYNIKHQEYTKTVGYIGSESTPGTLLYKLKELKQQLSSLQAQEEPIKAEKNSLILQASMDNPYFEFTEQEKITIHTLFHDTDYQNSNILTTSIDTAVSTIDKEKELYDDCVSKLSEVCQPQMTFSVELDNLLNLDEFKRWEEDFTLLRFIRLGIRDDYSVKLRIVGRSWNPCDITPNVTVEFSNMITSRSGRSDLTDLFDSENNRGSKNSISIGTGNSKNDKDYMTNLLQVMIDTNLFKNAVGNIAGNTVGPLDEDMVNGLIRGYLNLHKLEADKIYVDKGSFNKVFSKYIDTEFISSKISVVDMMYAENILTDNITSASGNFTKYLTGVRIVGDIIEGSTIIADKLVLRGNTDSVVYQLNQLGTLTSEQLSPEEVEKYQINGKIIVAQSITSEQINVHDLWATGIVHAANAEIIDAKINNLTSIAADVGNFHIEGMSLYMGENRLGSNKPGSIYIGEDGFSCEDKFIYDIKNQTLTINGDGTFSGTLNGATGSFTGDVTANGKIQVASGDVIGGIQIELDKSVTAKHISWDTSVSEPFFIMSSSLVTKNVFSITSNIGSLFVPDVVVGKNAYFDTLIYTYGLDTLNLQAINATIQGLTTNLISCSSAKGLLIETTEAVHFGSQNGTTIFEDSISTQEIYGNLYGTATKLAASGNISNPMVFNWSGQPGQPTWVWGGNSEANQYVFNPANFNVSSATKLLLKGIDTIKNDATGLDTPSNWTAQGISGHYYSAKRLENQPTQYGYVLNITQGNPINGAGQLWFPIQGGTLCHREGNSLGWERAWKKILDETNYMTMTGLNYAIGTNWKAITSYSGDGTTALGTSSNRYTNVYAKNSAIQTSDENEKIILSGITEPYEALFMSLKPILYKWKQFENETHIHDRVHCGFGAQSVLETAKKYGLNEKSFAAICRDNLDSPTIDGRTERWGIAYSELHGLEIHMIQKNTITLEEHKQKIQALEQIFTKRIEILENKLNQLERASA